MLDLIPPLYIPNYTGEMDVLSIAVMLTLKVIIPSFMLGFFIFGLSKEICFKMRLVNDFNFHAEAMDSQAMMDPLGSVRDRSYRGGSALGSGSVIDDKYN
mmetsp:Transcript_1344/g.1375  ORF Transcript_1344/g.1375 Transcript_1344/m.1375 type:complete len:100 (+) Transcript_1344:1101-1400(+)